MALVIMALVITGSLLSLNLTHADFACAMDPFHGCDFREGIVHMA